MKRLLPAALIAASAFAFPAHAQDAALTDPAGERVNQIIVYGDDPCPASPDGTITVCARKEEEERFRIPAPLRDNPNAAVNQAWSQRVRAYETVGAFGTNSCSAVGAGGTTGCVSQLINRAYAEKKSSTDVQFGKLIEEERARRLQNLDADAAAEQGRVEQIEKEYEARLKRERDAAEAAQPGPTLPAPQP